LLSLVKFYSDSCEPCKLLTKTLKEYSEKYPEVTITEVNAPKNMNLVQEHQVQAVPTLLIFKNGFEVKRIVGNAPLNVLENILNEFRDIQSDVFSEPPSGEENTSDTLLPDLSKSED